MTSSSLVRLFLTTMIVVLVAASFYTYWTIRERQVAFESTFRYNVAYSASQAVVEFERLHNALLQLQRDRTPQALSEAQLRYKILNNRATIFDRGGAATQIGWSAENEQLITDTQAGIRRIGPILDSSDVEVDVDRLLSILNPLEPQIIGLFAAAADYGSQQLARQRDELGRLNWRFSILLFGLILCSFCLVGMLGLHNRLLFRAHRDLSLTTGDLKRAAHDIAAANERVAAANTELRRQNRLLIEKENALHAQNVLFDAAINNMSQGLCMLDDAMRPVVSNKQFASLMKPGSENDAAAASGEEQPASLNGAPSEIVHELKENIRRKRPAAFETQCGDGRIIAVVQQPLAEGGWVATFENVTEQRRAQSRIAHMATHDGLTNLPNRYAFRERIQEALTECEAKGSMLAVLCLDLDNFKEVNDTLGHPSGDALLCSAAARLTASVRDTDMVARLGGDEFAILQPNIDRFDDAERLAGRIVEEMCKPFLINDEFVYGTGSVGVAIAPKHGRDPDALVKHADLALYAAKSDGRRTYRFFRNEMDEMLTRRHALERDLRAAITTGQLDLHFQPLVHLHSRGMTGLEALLRWTHPTHGAVPPATFIPIAEASGLIGPIGRWVLAEACAEAAQWPPHLKLSVNLSAAQFRSGDIVEDIRGALSRAGLRPERLVVEITESLLLTESTATFNALQRMKALGIEIAMDDFGTGYSSLSYLRKYPFDRIKIDRGFVNNVSCGGENAAIVETIVRLSASLGMTAVAEGIETERQLDMLLAAGCPEGQGYFFSRPVRREDVSGIFDSGEHRISKVA